MAKTQFLEYTIYLTDAALVAQLQGDVHAGGAIGRTVMAPSVAATTYSAPIQEESTPMVAPCIRSEWFTTGNNFPRDQRTFQRCNGGWFGICFLFGTRINFYWRGQFKYQPILSPTVAPTGGVKVAMAKRRWVDGFELPDFGEAGSGNAAIRANRGASRHLQGYGLHFDRATTTRTHTPVESGGATTSRGWDRFYVRFRQFPTAKSRMWKTSSSAGATAGVSLEILPSGQLGIVNIDSVSAETLIATLTTAFVLHRWYKVDVIYQYKSTAKGTLPYLGIYINGVQAADLQGVWTADGLGLDGLLANVTLGTAVANSAVWDCDDWISSECPTGTSLTPSTVGTFPGEDWNHGSRVALLGAAAFGSDNAASWAAAGTFRHLRQRAVVSGVTTYFLRNATTGARLCILTDANREIDNTIGQLGLAAMTIAVYSRESGNLAGQLGYRLPGGAAVMVAAPQGAGNYAWSTAFYQPSMNDPIHPCAGLEILFDHGAGVTNQDVQFLGAAAEIIGVFGQEDAVPGATAELAGETPEVTQNDATQTVAYITRLKAQLVARGISLAGSCGAFEIVKRAAWGLRDAGAGLLIKTTGNNCGGYAVDQLCFPSGRIVDILGDAGGANTPSYSEGTAVDATRYHVAIDPEDAGSLRVGPPEHLGIHNAPYPHSQWARRGGAPFSPVVVHGGTYVGTGTFIDLPFRAPVHLVYVRALSGITTGVHLWWSSMTDGHIAGQLGYTMQFPAEVLIDPNFPAVAPAEDAQEQQTLFRIIGNDANSNAVGVVYQFVAFSDPGMRFMEAGALWATAGVLDIVTTLNNEAFTPDACLIQQEANGGGATMGLHFKGTGHAANNLNPFNAAEIAGLFLSKGALTSKSALHNGTNDEIAYLAIRKDDGSGDTGVFRTIALTTYVGDGNAARTVGMLMGGRRPLFALVIGASTGTSIMRDPSHAGTASLAFPAAVNAATGITAGGIDSISVGIALNANGVTYNVFVLPGDTVAGNAGWSQNGEFVPVAPDSPSGEGFGLWDATPPDPELAPDEPTDTVPTVTPVLPDGQTGSDFTTGCITETTFVINQALSLIGISKQIGDITTELSNEATTCRLHYLDDVKATLRQFPWAFATRYARLVLVAGTSSAPVNNDWQYSYREPSDSVFSRRITNANQIRRAFDPTPVDFRIGADATGKLIYTNQGPTDDQDLTPLLEYTALTTCAATQGDSIFRRALAWRHAASIAPALCKDQKKGEYCMAMFERVIVQAEVASANENQMDPEGDADWITGRA